MIETLANPFTDLLHGDFQYSIQQPLTLYFADFETIVLFVSVLLVNLLIQDGKSNYMEGMMLMSLYIIIALAFWVS
ncbi:Vacuolar membrane antiporter with Ca2+/H+ and K+/H+ exchange activity [Tulasnella sp. JGI-2019a]|nr:Vacuolar membrane antiporter with Ca2+/H+ and K+/H+ exchange activity [Tulasnella sp. JGI-2019a]